jgi:hypothetical protein
MSDWIELGIPYGSVWSSTFPYEEMDSFAKRELNKPGTLIRMQNGKVYLIGDINEIKGMCDDCTAFESESIVDAYKVVWKPEE